MAAVDALLKGFVWHYPGEVLRVVDADTIRLRLDLGYSVFTDKNCRIEGVNAAEVSTVAGRAARDWAATILTAGMTVLFTSRTLDKYGRPLGDLATSAFASWRAELLAAGQAVPYP